MFRKKSTSMPRKMTQRYSTMVCSSSLYSLRTTDEDKPACGFLNRKTVLEVSGKKSKDRTWQTFWCQVKDNKMDFYKVNGFTLKPHGEPPPKDIYPPPNRQKQNTGFVFLENSLVELDYTSQEEKDLDKRRKFLFRLILSNKTEFLFQCPSENIMLQWVSHIKRCTFSTDPDLSGPSELMLSDARIKASRCSINKKSKHNTNSVRVTATVDGDDEVDANLVSLVKLDPRLVHLKKRLQNKRDLTRQLQKMLSSFSGDTNCLYREAETPHIRLTSRSGSNPPEMDEKSVPRYSASSNGSAEGFAKTTTTLLEDYYMLPGVEWSLLKKGEPVEVLGKLSGGWYRCRANKDTSYVLEEFPTDIESPTEDNEHSLSNADEGEVKSPIDRDELTSTPTLLKQRDSSLLDEISTSLGEDYIPKDIFDKEDTRGESTDDGTEEDGHFFRTKSISMAYANPIVDIAIKDHSRNRTESYVMATGADPIGTFKRQNLFRKNSYNTATTAGSLVDTIELTSRGGHLPTLEPIRDPSPVGSSVPSTPSFSHEYELKRLRINNILDHEKANNKYVFPLIGLVPASVLRNFICQTTSGIRPSSSTSDYGSAGPLMDDKSSIYNGHTKSSSFDATSKMAELDSDSLQSQDKSNERFSSSYSEAIMYSIPNHVSGQEQKRKHSDRSLSLPTASLGDEEAILAILPTIPNEYLENDDAIVDDEREEDDDESKPTAIKRRKSSKKLCVVPTPTSSPEKKGLGNKILKQEQENENRPEKLRGHKRSNSDDGMTEKQHKGLLSRIRSNITGLKKSASESPKHHRHNPAIPSRMTDEAQMRSRVTSISGKAMRPKEMGITFGDSSSESESDEPEEKTSKGDMDTNSDTSTNSLLVSRKQLSIDNDNLTSNGDTTPEAAHEPVFKTYSTPTELLKMKAKARIQPDSSPEPVRSRTESKSLKERERRNSILQDGINMSGFIQAPPRGVCRQIYLDPSVKKFGFHLEKYEIPAGGQAFSRTIIQHVVPGSHAFVAGFFPGDQIVAVNGLHLRNASVKEVANAIQQANPNRKIEVTVSFVEGAIRLKKKQERGDLQIKLIEKQKNLDGLVATQKSHKQKIPSPSPSPIPLNTLTHVRELGSWREDTPPEENSLHIYNYNRHINDILSLHHGDVTLLSCDMLVMPLQRVVSNTTEDNVRDVLRAGGEGLMDELSLAKQCELGENIYTEGHRLSVKTICHCLFGTNDEEIFKCCRHALKTARQKNYKNIVFWISGFISTSYISPHHVICAIRGWLEEGENCSRDLKVVLSVPSTPAMISLVERYFPLEDYKLHDFLQDLNYFTSDDEDGEGTRRRSNSNGNSNNETDVAPQIPARSPRITKPFRNPPPVPTKSNLSNETSVSSDSPNRTVFVKSKFSEIDDIMNDIQFQVKAMKK